ncbi:flippase-like domain-containing protein [Dactylosporangium sp. NBC_01737]|uniref:lysylphosphatidylglycerol synthase transmembrane domain-containing protein n=1 Tax=Dactylosporangium sp. NBC_01737 TaxID=2975959 RepID=UPI002E129D5D|nr:flippase-like domain-containing protein [Dactylosporangium sp. NBC_01737]
MSTNEVAVDLPPDSGTAGGGTAGSVWGSSLPRMLLAVAVAVTVVVLAVMHWSTVSAGAAGLARANSAWLVVAGLGTASIWIAGTITQIGSMSLRPPVGKLLAVQVAASFANHVLPAGSGGMGINIRFLRKHGLGSGAAVGSVGLNSFVGMVTHVLLLVVAVAVSPSLARGIQVPGSWRDTASRAAGPAGWVLLAIAGALLAAALVASVRPAWRRRLAGRVAAAGRRVAEELRGLWGVLRDPYRAAALWLGSLCTPLLHAVILYAVLRSLGVAVTVGTAFVVYLVVSSLSAFVPSPGGIGALDVAMLAGLAAIGVTSAVALGAVVGYRLITVWVPLLPSAFVLAVLLRRRII